MNAGPRYFDLCRRSEGLRLSAFFDTRWTIGVGHTGPEVHSGLVWTPWQAEATFKADTAEKARRVCLLLGSMPTQGQFDAMLDFAFNMGATALAGSTLLHLHRMGNFEAASHEFIKWDHEHRDGKLVEVPGLKTRRLAEAELYRS